MNVELISIGDELLIGQTINTNASWLGAELSHLGANILRSTSIPDDDKQIQKTLHKALFDADLVIITGGLGPTKDDITKQALADYFNDELAIDRPTLEHVQRFFSHRKLPFLDVNIQQAAVPKSCTILHNKLGTAPGMWFEDRGKVVISLPGVPYEMMEIMREEGLPRIKKKWTIRSFYFKTGNLQGIGESYLADQIQDIEEELKREELSLAYLPSPGLIRLRIGSKNGQEQSERIDSYFAEIEKRFPKHFYGYGTETLAEKIGILLQKNKVTVGTIESCTAGKIAAEIGSVAGASAYFEGGIVSYSNRLKEQLVGVRPETIEKFGAVSEEVAKEMAIFGKQKLSVDYCIAVSGLAGPTGASEQKPIGTTWIAIATPDKISTQKFIFENNRQRNITRSVLSALNMLRLELEYS